jgi:hypothetical protein
MARDRFDLRHTYVTGMEIGCGACSEKRVSVKLQEMKQFSFRDRLWLSFGIVN